MTAQRSLSIHGLVAIPVQETAMEKAAIQQQDLLPDQLAECVAKIREGHESAEFHRQIVEKHGKDAIKGALLAGRYVAEAERIIKGNEPWIQWCEQNIPGVSYKTLSRYRLLYENWTALSNEQRDACETLNDAYLKCGINGGVEKKTAENPKRRSRRSRSPSKFQKGGNGAKPEVSLRCQNAKEATAQIISELNRIPEWDCKEIAKARKAVEPIVAWYQRTDPQLNLAAA